MLTVTPFALLVDGMAVAFGRPGNREPRRTRPAAKPAAGSAPRHGPARD